MIVTITANPSIDHTVTMGTPLSRGAVHRVQSASIEPGGKGVNVARALTSAGFDAVAVIPAPAGDRCWPRCSRPACRFNPCRRRKPCAPI